MENLTVSIILPTYNRAKFLPESIGAIRGQKFTGWELIVVDDGSTDETAELLPRLVEGMMQPYRYIRQENGGAYAARNTGLDHVRGRYVAFYDSDDLWLPHHLQKCVAVLEEHPHIDWVYGACQIVDTATGRCVCENTFVDGNGRRIPQFAYVQQIEGRLHCFVEDYADRALFRVSPNAGLQNSVIRAGVFTGTRFETEFRNETEDSLFLIRSVLAGRRLAMLDQIHVVYRLHESQSSSAGAVAWQKKANVLSCAVSAYLHFLRTQPMTRPQKAAFRKMLSTLVFWRLGYATYGVANRREDSLRAYCQAIKLWPWDLRYWKTLLISLVRTLSVWPGKSCECAEVCDDGGVDENVVAEGDVVVSWETCETESDLRR